jgi:hypothetical protein
MLEEMLKMIVLMWTLYEERLARRIDVSEILKM